MLTSTCLTRAVRFSLVPGVFGAFFYMTFPYFNMMWAFVKVNRFGVGYT